MSDSIRSTRQFGVNLDNAQPPQQHRGLGAQPGIGGQSGPMAPGSTIRAIMGGAAERNGQPVGGFNWRTGAGGIETNEVLAGMLEAGGGIDAGSQEYYISKAEYPMVQFFNFMMRREQKLFYHNYITVRDAFILDNQTGVVDPIKKDFVEEISRRPEFIKTVGSQGMIIFGYILIEELRRSNKEEWTQQDYFNGVQLAVSHLLLLEFISWICYTKKGQGWINRLPKRLEEILNNLSVLKEQFSVMWDFFDAPFPYEKLDFVKRISTPIEYARLNDPDMYAEFLGFTPGRKVDPGHQNIELQNTLEMIRRNAQEFNNGGYQQHQYQQAASQPQHEEVNMTWGNFRNDLENLDVQNKHTFDLKHYFKYTGRPNHYYVAESDWKHIQRVFRRHQDQRQEHAIARNIYRVIVIDLDKDDGWFSFPVRLENVDVPILIQNPALLLPPLDKMRAEGDQYENIVPVTLEEVADDRLTVKIPAIKKHGKGTPAIVVSDPVVSTEAKTIVADINLITNKVTSDLKGQAACIFTEVSTWDVYEVKAPEIKTRLFHDVPFLFADSDLDERPNIVEAGIILGRYFEQKIIPEGLANFINGRLTDITNQWLSNVCGYNVVDGKGGGGKLQIESFITGIQLLNDHLRKTDALVWNALIDAEADNYLNNHLKMFHKVNRFLTAPENMSAIDKLKDDNNLYFIRDLYIANVVNDGGPIYVEPNVPQYIKRSVLPELFQLMEVCVEVEGDGETESETPPLPYQDRLLRFSSTEHVWLFSHSIEDRNVATLRHVDTDKPLVLLKVN